MKNKSISTFLIFVASVTFSHSTLAGQTSAKAKIARKPSGQSCVVFKGDVAKKTFNTLYPWTQGDVTAIVATPNVPTGETDISTPNIYCRVWTATLPSDAAAAQKALEAMTSDKFQCGYLVASDGGLSACSDQQ